MKLSKKFLKDTPCLLTPVQSSSGATLSAKLNFNHPVKELVWTYPGIFFDDIKLTLNGHDRIKARDYKYFTRNQVWQHHSGYGGCNNDDSIAVYSFALLFTYYCYYIIHSFSKMRCSYHSIPFQINYVFNML